MDIRWDLRRANQEPACPLTSSRTSGERSQNSGASLPRQEHHSSHEKATLHFLRHRPGEKSLPQDLEDRHHLAFLSIFPNTKGFTVVIPKRHHASYAFTLPDQVLCRLVLAAGKVARLLDRKLPGVGRTGMIFEGFGVDHVHAKLFPMHGTGNLKRWKPISSRLRKVFRRYEGYISSHDGPRASDMTLRRLAAKIHSAPRIERR